MRPTNITFHLSGLHIAYQPGSPRYLNAVAAVGLRHPMTSKEKRQLARAAEDLSYALQPVRCLRVHMLAAMSPFALAAEDESKLAEDYEGAFASAEQAKQRSVEWLMASGLITERANPTRVGYALLLLLHDGWADAVKAIVENLPAPEPAVEEKRLDWRRGAAATLGKLLKGGVERHGAVSPDALKRALDKLVQEYPTE